MKRLVSLALIFVVLLAGTAVVAAQQYQGQQYQGGAQQGAGQARTLSIPPAPPRSQPNMEYGNTARAAYVGERLSDAAEGNARVYITEDGAIAASVYMLQDANAYDIAGTMANFTYMLADMYRTMTERSDSDILLKVYDKSNSMIIDAKFSASKNAFEYFDITQAEAPPQRQQPVAGQYQGMQGQGMQRPTTGQMPMR
jgi:hypothetical protein